MLTKPIPPLFGWNVAFAIIVKKNNKLSINLVRHALKMMKKP